MLSIPQWSDFNFEIPYQCRNGSGLSIPQWSDFNYFISLYQHVLSDFQSHNGLILTSIDVDSYTPTIYFQSHNGLILTHFHRSSSPKCHNLSIPQWSDFNTISSERIKSSIQLSIPQWSDFNYSP